MKGVHAVGKDEGSEEKIHARLRELADATRRVRKDLEDLIRNKPYREHTRGVGVDGSTADDRANRDPDE
jgi:hypothetical protein